MLQIDAHPVENFCLRHYCASTNMMMMMMMTTTMMVDRTLTLSLDMGPCWRAEDAHDDEKQWRETDWHHHHHQLQ